MLNKGFTFIEALMAVIILTFIAAAALTSIIILLSAYRKDIVSYCLQQAVYSALEYKRANPTSSETSLTYTCKGLNINVQIQGNTPQPNRCVQITATASYGVRTFSASDVICNFVD